MQGKGIGPDNTCREDSVHVVMGQMGCLWLMPHTGLTGGAARPRRRVPRRDVFLKLLWRDIACLLSDVCGCRWESHGVGEHLGRVEMAHVGEMSVLLAGGELTRVNREVHVVFIREHQLLEIESARHPSTSESFRGIVTSASRPFGNGD